MVLPLTLSDLTDISVDEDMHAMYLTDKLNNVSRPIHDHEDLELLLESFSKQVEEIVNEAENIEVKLDYTKYTNQITNLASIFQANVQSTQEIVELILDSNRNALLTLDLKVRLGPSFSSF